MKDKFPKRDILVKGPFLELKSIKLDEEVPVPTPNEPHMSDHKKETDRIPIGEFNAIKNRTPPTMVEQIRVKGPFLELKSIKLDEEVPVPTPNEPHMSDHKKETDRIPIGEFNAIKDRTPPTMVEE